MNTPTRWIAAALSSAALVAGCVTTAATTARLTYQTSPAGAQLFEGGLALGMEPVTRTYRSDGTPGDIRTPEVRAVWPSGATQTFYALIPVGSDREATIERPADAPNLQQDQDNAKAVLAARQRDADRLKADRLREQKRGSDRCKAQQSGQSLAVSDDCD